jgi:hypothetical protein
MPEDISRQGIKIALERDFNIQPNELVSIGLLATTNEYMTVIAHLQQPARAAHLHQAMSLADVNARYARYNPALHTVLDCPREPTLDDLGTCVDYATACCPFTTCHYHRSNDLASTTAKERHLQKFHLTPLLTANPGLLAGHSLHICPQCQNAVFITAAALQSHVDALCSNPPKNSSTMDMNLDDNSDDDDDDDPFDASSYEDDDSPPYHESQDIDYYESIRRICPYQHRNDLEQLINEKCNHATLLKKVLMWQEVAETKP